MLDVTITATLRPELLERTLQSFRESVNSSWGFRCLLNVDPVGGGSLDQLTRTAQAHFDHIVIRTPKKADWLNAIKWLWMRVKSPVFFHLEDDWVFNRPVSADSVVDIFEQEKKLGYLCLRKKSIKAGAEQQIGNEWITYRKRVHGQRLGLQPSFWRRRLARDIVALLPETTRRSPEKLMREGECCEAAVMQWKDADYGKINTEPWVTDIGREWRAERGLKRGKDDAQWS